MTEMEGIPFGRYRLIGLLGQGGMATVYRALLSGPMGFEKEVALKRIHSEAAEDEGLIKSLVNEARLGGSLRHPHIVETYEFNRLQGIYYVALEYVDGWSLDVLLKLCRKLGRPVPLLAVHEIMIQACRGLSHAHNLVTRSGERPDLVHRDLKPGNIMVSRTGVVKLMDFGIAKAATNLYQTTSADVVRGTPVYMSPEQLRAQKLDKRSDIFAMGAVLHELTTLQIPFAGENLIAITYQIAECNLGPLRQRVAKRHPHLEPVLARAMAKDRDDRFPDAQDLADALEASAGFVEDSLGLKKWLGLIEAHLPPVRKVGDFGRVGAPSPITDEPSGVTSAAPAGAPTPTPQGLPSLVQLQSGDIVPITTVVQVNRSRRIGLALGVVGLVLAIVDVGLGLRSPGNEDSSEEEATAPLSSSKSTGPDSRLSSPAEPAPSKAVTAVTAVAADQPESTPTPSPEPTPDREPPASAVAVRAAPRAAAPPPDDTPEVEAPAEMGAVVLHSIPWSHLEIDGVPAGKTLLRTELPVGTHRVLFRCTQCDPTVEKEETITVKAGAAPLRTVVKFQ